MAGTLPSAGRYNTGHRPSQIAVFGCVCVWHSAFCYRPGKLLCLQVCCPPAAHNNWPGGVSWHCLCRSCVPGACVCLWADQAWQRTEAVPCMI